jgi:hypothetical protein
VARTNNGARAAPFGAILMDGHGVEIVDVSYTGCRLRGVVPLTAGGVGLLTIWIDGEPHTELFRVCRAVAVHAGDDRTFEAGIEFLPLVSDTPSIRDAIFQLTG